MNAVLFSIIAYVLIQFAIGVWVSRRIASAQDFILAGRQLGPGLVAFSVFATFFGSEAIVATGSTVYENGLNGALVDPLAYAVALIIVGSLFARALWSRGSHDVCRPVPAALLAGRGTAGRNRPDPRLRHLGGRADPRVSGRSWRPIRAWG